MADKKFPERFTVRFNIADPQQREAAGLLNQLGRSKAQFLTNAVLHYVRCGQAPDTRSAATVDRGQIERVVLDILAQRQGLFPPREPKPLVNSENTDALSEGDRNAIFDTLNAFQKKQ